MGCRNSREGCFTLRWWSLQVVPPVTWIEKMACFVARMCMSVCFVDANLCSRPFLSRVSPPHRPLSECDQPAFLSSSLQHSCTVLRTRTPKTDIMVGKTTSPA